MENVNNNLGVDGEIGGDKDKRDGKNKEEEDTNIDIITRNYLTPSHPTAFSSPANIKRFYGDKFSRKTIARALAALDAYTLHREYKRPKYHNPIYVYALREHVQMDLMDMSRYAQDNDNITFIMIAVDAFSKKAWVYPMLRKTMAISLEKFKLLVRDVQPKIKAVLLDRGSEFRNRLVIPYLRKEKIKMIHPYSETKAPMAERFIRTLKDLIFKYLDGHETRRYIDVLDDLVLTYNNRIHNTLKTLTPNEAEKDENKEKVLCALNNYYVKAVGGIRKHVPKYVVGQKVRIKNLPGKFHRGWQDRFNVEHFEIVRVNTRMPIPMYNLKSLNDGEKIRGGFYSNELVLIEGDVFKIEKVLKEETVDGKTRLFVKWVGYDDRHNSWIDSGDVVQTFNNNG